MIPFSVYKHHSGRFYLLLFVANIHSGKWPHMAVYVDKGGKFWCRPLEEFEEKFVFEVAGAALSCSMLLKLIVHSFSFALFKKRFKDEITGGP